MPRKQTPDSHIDPERVRIAASKALPAIVSKLLPDGHMRGHHWMAKNSKQQEQRPGSFKIDLKTGHWEDQKSYSSGDDVVALASFLRRLKYEQAVQEIARMLAGEPGLFSPLMPEDYQNAPIVPSEEDLHPIVPVPANAPPMAFCHPAHGEPTAQWTYRDEVSRLIGYKSRFDYIDSDGDAAKEYLPITYCQTETGFAWRAKGFPKPWRLYRLPEVLSRAGATLLVCEGEKTAEAAAVLFPEMATTTPPFGAQGGTADTDWSPVKGRRVIVAPDNDFKGHVFCERVCELAYLAGANEVWILPPEKIGSRIWRDGQKRSREVVPEGWDLADAVSEGWTAASVAEEAEKPDFLERAPKPLVAGEHGRSAYRLSSEGVERWVKTRDEAYWKLVCGPLELIAETRDGDEKNWGKVFKLTNADGKVIDWHSSNSLLARDGAEYREELHSLGLRIESGKADRDYLQEYLSTVTTANRARRVDRVGWHGDVYVTNTCHIGQSPNNERIVFAGSTQSKIGQSSGSRTDWQENIAACATGNSRLVFAICAAFAAPLLYHTRSESGGFHFVGPSSVGKSTALVVAGSVWGGGGTGGYLRSWRATANGLEGLAAAHCDGLLCLDEMGQANSREAGAAAYMLANGFGKQRANLRGEARSMAEWRIIFLSTGEVGLADKVGEDSRNGPVAAGQQIRIIDLEADAGSGMGMFENIHAHASASEFARHLKKGAATDYGHAGPEFVGMLTQDMPSALAEVERLIKAFVERYLPQGKVDGQVERVAQKFALVAAAGEMAISFGIVEWTKGTASSAVGRCFQGWIDARGTTGSLEDEEAVRHVRGYIERYGSSRFFDSNKSEDYQGVMDIPLQNRVGFIRHGEDGREYCFFQEGWKNDVCKGRDHKAVARALRAQKFLSTDEGRLNKGVKVKTKNTRCFVVNESILLEPGEEPAKQASVIGLKYSADELALREKLKSAKMIQ